MSSAAVISIGLAIAVMTVIAGYIVAYIVDARDAGQRQTVQGRKASGRLVQPESASPGRPARLV